MCMRMKDRDRRLLLKSKLTISPESSHTVRTTTATQKKQNKKEEKKTSW